MGSKVEGGCFLVWFAALAGVIGTLGIAEVAGAHVPGGEVRRYAVSSAGCSLRSRNPSERRECEQCVAVTSQMFHFDLSGEERCHSIHWPRHGGSGGSNPTPPSTPPPSTPPPSTPPSTGSDPRIYTDRGCRRNVPNALVDECRSCVAGDSQIFHQYEPGGTRCRDFRGRIVGGGGGGPSTPPSNPPPTAGPTCNPPHSGPVGNRCVPSCGAAGGNECGPQCRGRPLIEAYDCNQCCNTSGESTPTPPQRAPEVEAGPTCNPPHSVAVGGRCVDSCGAAGGNTCAPRGSGLCDGRATLESYDCNQCCAVP